MDNSQPQESTTSPTGALVLREWKTTGDLVYLLATIPLLLAILAFGLTHIGTYSRRTGSTKGVQSSMPTRNGTK